MGIARRQYASRGRTPDSVLLAAGGDERFLRLGFVARSRTPADRNVSSSDSSPPPSPPSRGAVAVAVTVAGRGVGRASVRWCCRPDSVCIPVNARRIVAASNRNE